MGIICKCCLYRLGYLICLIGIGFRLRIVMFLVWFFFLEFVYIEFFMEYRIVLKYIKWEDGDLMRRYRYRDNNDVLNYYY